MMRYSYYSRHKLRLHSLKYTIIILQISKNITVNCLPALLETTFRYKTSRILLFWKLYLSIKDQKGKKPTLSLAIAFFTEFI